MSNPEQHDDWNDDQPEITSLDPKVEGFVAGSIKLLLQFRQKMRNSLRLRAASIGFTLLLCLLVLLIVIQPHLPFAAGHTSPQQNYSSTSSSSPSSLLVNALAYNGVVFINAPNGTLNAYRAGDGKLLWHRQIASSGFLAATTQALYRFTGIAASYGNVEAFRASDGSLLWRQQVPPGGILPLIVQDGTVYFNSHEGVVYALRASDGHILWHFMSGLRIPFDGFFSASDGIASILTGEGMVYVLHASDGSPIYHFPAPSNQSYYWWAPVIDNGMIYTDIDLASVQARSTRDGSLVWQYRAQGSGLWPAVVDSGVVYISAPGGSIKALRGQDGALLWQYEAKAVINPPVVYNQLAYLVRQDGRVDAVRTIDGVPLWHWRPLTPSEGSVTPLIVSDGIVYINLDVPGGIAYALQASTGQVLWHHALSTTIPRYLPVASDGVLYLGTDDRSIEAWRGSDGHFLWRYASPALLEWHPEADNGILLVRPLNGTLDVLRMGDGKLLWRYNLPS